MKRTTFSFRQFSVVQSEAVHKVGTDGVLLGAWADVQEARRILDIGTGTGLIALMAAQRTNPECSITGIDADEAATDLAELNFSNSPWASRLKVETVRLQDFHDDRAYDHILTNPPFFMNSLAPPDPKRKIQRHTDELTFEELVNAVTGLLKADGRWSVILPVTESKVLERLASTNGLLLHRETFVKPKIGATSNRRLMEFRFTPAGTYESEIILMDNAGKRHPQYGELTREFYV